jgi:hypothetical protein
LHPAHVDGRTLAILHRRGHQFFVTTSGQLEYDGETLTLVSECQRRMITEPELASFMVVRLNTQITLCKGFDLFLIEEGVADSAG